MFNIKRILMLIAGGAAAGGILLGCGTTPTKSEILRKEAVMNSPQWRDGKFHNTLERKNSPFWKVITSMIGNENKNTVPKTAVPVVKRCGKDFAGTPAGGLRITWLGHSTVLIEIDGYRVLTDPVWSERVSPVPFAGPKRFFNSPLSLSELPELDAVLISHDHYDHLDKKTIEALKDRVPLFAVPLGVGAYLEDWGVDPSKIKERDWWGGIDLGRLKVTAVPARHFSGRTIALYQDKTLWCGWSVAGPKHRVYFSGDTAMFPGFNEIGERLGPFDVTLMETGAYNTLWPDVHIGPEQAVKAHKMVKGKLMMPVHWGTFDLSMHNWTEPVERLIEAARKGGVSAAIPRPGESVNPSLAGTVKKWWPELPWKDGKRAPVVSTGMERQELNAGLKNDALSGAGVSN